MPLWGSPEWNSLPVALMLHVEAHVPVNGRDGGPAGDDPQDQAASEQGAPPVKHDEKTKACSFRPQASLKSFFAPKPPKPPADDRDAKKARVE